MVTASMKHVARATGVALLLTIGLGIITSVFVSGDINVNVNADAREIIDAMRGAAGRVYGKAWIGAGLAALDAFIAAGLYLLVRQRAPFAALASLLVAVLAAALSLDVAAATLNAANLLESRALANTLNPGEVEMLLTALVATDYSVFHLGTVVNAAAKAGFFALLLVSRRVPRPLAGWGLFASLFVVTGIVGRDFIGALGHNAISIAFILCNLVAYLALGLYLTIRGVRVTQ